MSQADVDPLKRILVLVPHEPDLDPRIGWSLSLCRELGRTELIATTWSTKKPVKQYDGVVSIERIEATVYASPFTRRLAAALGRLDSRPAARAFAERAGTMPSGGLRARLDHHVGAAFRLAAAWGYYSIIISALARRARAVSVKPQLILCHDLYALLAGVTLKKQTGAHLVYDAHEYFPESDLLAPRWQQRLIRRLERHFIREADAVITVSPPLAAEFQQVYGISRVVSVPNAEPFREVRQRVDFEQHSPVRFLLQGQASPGRGIDRLLELWERLDDPRAVLLLRIPDGDYPKELRRRFARLLDSERAQWLNAVPEDELVAAASAADVGVIPYVGPSKNHLYASPNKLSQYMLAGLAILSNDLPYISSLLAQFECGLTYDASDEASFRRTIDTLVSDPVSLERMRKRAFVAARDEFNWQTVSEDYREVLTDLYES